VVTWGLAETAVVQLLRAPIPVFVGLPDKAVIDADLTGERDQQEELSVATRLAALERLFSEEPLAACR